MYASAAKEKLSSAAKDGGTICCMHGRRCSATPPKVIGIINLSGGNRRGERIEGQAHARIV